MEGYIGEVRMFGGNFAPRSWAYCHGQLLPINQNQALFSIIGTIYGGDGRTTFALPDLRGRTPIGPGHGPGLSDYREGAKGGVESVTLNITEIPSHDHSGSGTVQASLTPANSNNPNGKNFGLTDGATSVWTAAAANIDFQANDIAVTVGNNGGNLSHENRMPSLALHYIICLYGIFPSRS